MPTDLANLQTLLYRAISGAPGAAARSDIGVLCHTIRGDERLGAPQRVGIYADAYFYRLHDCLKEDFPATAMVAGDPSFEDLVRSYLAEYPPTEPSIFYAGRYLADFLANHRLSERWPWLAELARLERTTIEVFHDRNAATLSADDITAIAPADWPSLALRTPPAVRILDGGWRVNDVLGAFGNGTEWREPAPGPTTLLVWRQHTQVYYRELDAPEHAALELAARGAGFGAICAAYAERVEAADAAGAINQALRRWVADGLLARDR